MWQKRCNPPTTSVSDYCITHNITSSYVFGWQVGEICNIDPCHKFAWCLDACIRERYVDNKRSRELQAFLDNIRRGQDHVIG